MNGKTVLSACCVLTLLCCGTWTWVGAQSEPFADILNSARKDSGNADGMRTEARTQVIPQGSRRDEQGRVVLLDCRVKLMHEVQVACQQPGVLDFVVAEGQSVQKGQLLAHTADDLLKASLAIADRQAKNDVEVRLAQKEVELKQVQYERDLEANRINPGTVSDLTLQEHRLDVERALLQLEQAKTAVEIERLKRDETRTRLRQHHVLASSNGAIRTVLKHVGETVREGDAILEIVNTDRMRVEGYVHMRHLSSVHPGTTVAVRMPSPGSRGSVRTLTGRIVSVDVKVEPLTHLVKVWAEVPNEDNILKDGLRAEMVVQP